MPSRLPTRDLRTRRLRLRVPLRIRRRLPSLARFAVREAALALRSLTGIGRGMRSEDGVRKTALCYSRHHRLSREAPRQAGWGLAANFEGQPGDQTTGPQGAPRMGAPTAGAKDAPFGRPVGFLAAHQPARVRRRAPACRGGGAAPCASRPAGARQLGHALAPADARPADATAQAPRPAPHSPPLAFHGSLRCPRGRAGAALGDGHRPQDAIRHKDTKRRWASEDGLRAAHSMLAVASKHSARQAGELAAEFEGQPGDQTAGPQGAPWTGAPTAGAKDAPFGRPVGLLAAHQPARVRRRPPACRGGVLLRARPSLPKRDAPSRFAPADARPADATAQAPRPAAHSPTLAILGSLRCPRGRAGAALDDGHRPKDAIRHQRYEAKMGFGRWASRCSLHPCRSREAPRKTGWGLAAEFEGQPSDQTTGPQGAPRTGAPTEGAKDAPFGRPVGLLAAHQPARVRRRPPACRGGGAVPGSRPAAVWVLLRAPRPVRRG